MVSKHIVRKSVFLLLIVFIFPHSLTTQDYLNVPEHVSMLQIPSRLGHDMNTADSRRFLVLSAFKYLISSSGDISDLSMRVSPDMGGGAVSFDLREGSKMAMGCGAWEIPVRLEMNGKVCYFQAVSYPDGSVDAYSADVDEKDLEFMESVIDENGIEFTPEGLIYFVDRVYEDQQELLTKTDRYEYRFLRPMFNVFFSRLQKDFIGADDFISLARSIEKKASFFALRSALNARRSDLVEAFGKIRPAGTNEKRDIGPYGILLYYLTANPGPYLGTLYDSLMGVAPSNNLVLGRLGISYHTRCNSVVHFYGKGLLFEGKNRSYMKSIKYGYAEKDIEDRRQSENGLKIRRALSAWEFSVRGTMSETMRTRINAFRESTTVVEMDVRTNLLVSDPENSVVRIVHAGRSRRVLYMPRLYLEKLDADNPDDMKELAVWLNFGQRLIDIQDMMEYLKSSQEDIQSVRAEVQREFFELEDSGLVNIDDLKRKLAELMKEDTIIKYTVLQRDLISKSDEAKRCLALCEQMPNRERFVYAKNLYGKLMYRYEGMNIHSKAFEAYIKMAYAVRKIQVYDEGLLPYYLQRELIFTALRFGLWEEFLTELAKLLTGEGYERPMDKRERQEVMSLVTPSRPGQKSFENDIKSALGAHLTAADKDDEARILEVSMAAQNMMKEFFREPFGNTCFRENSQSVRAYKPLPWRKSLCKGMIERIVALLMRNKVVIALDSGLGQPDSGIVLSVIEELALMKKDEKYGKLLENLEIVKGTPEHIVSRVRDLKDDRTLCFLFARVSEKEKLSPVASMADTAYIDEAGFPAGAYYPLAEMVFITLCKHMGDDLTCLPGGAFEEFNIASVDPDSISGAVIFRLLPGAEPLEKEDLIKNYVRLKEFIRAA